MKPRALREGATIGVVSPGSPHVNPDRLEIGIRFLTSLGFQVKVAPHARDRNGFLAGEDAHRARDLEDMFADPEVDAIIAVRGGYGSMRLLPLLDYGRIAAHPKILMGFSDITALQIALYKKIKLVTFHGPMLSSMADTENEYALRACLSVVMGESPRVSLCEGYGERYQTVQVLVPGKAEGVLAGGNLTLLASLQGTPYAPNFRGKILFLEEVGEAPYRVDRTITQLLLSGALAGVRGVAVGLFSACEDRLRGSMEEYRQSVLDVIRERLGPLNIPIVSGLPFGHVETNGTIPYGGRAILDGEAAGDLVLMRAVIP